MGRLLPAPGARRRRPPLRLGAAGAALLVLCGAGRADVPPAAGDDGPVDGSAPPAADDEGTRDAAGVSLRRQWVQEPEALRALERGLTFLASEQAQTRDGVFPKTGYEDERYAPIGVTAIGALAFMAAGSSPERGPHGREVTRAIDYLLAHVDLMPSSEERGNRYGYIAREGDTTSKIHGHAFATLALAQAWSMSPRSPRGERIEQALSAAVECIQSSQGSLGGWWYQPREMSEHEGSTTVCLVQALRAARNAGIRVDPDVIHRAETYVFGTQATEGPNAGRFAYQQKSDIYSIALTAAGVATLQAAGKYEGEALERGIDVLRKDLLDRADLGGEPPRFPYYERLYVAQALWQLDDQRWFDDWARTERERVIAEQRGDGSWKSLEFGDSYATAMNCLFLALPEGLLPIFQR